MGHVAWDIEHGAWGIEHGAWGMGHGVGHGVVYERAWIRSPVFLFIIVIYLYYFNGSGIYYYIITNILGVHNQVYACIHKLYLTSQPVIYISFT